MISFDVCSEFTIPLDVFLISYQFTWQMHRLYLNAPTKRSHFQLRVGFCVPCSAVCFVLLMKYYIYVLLQIKSQHTKRSSICIAISVFFCASWKMHRHHRVEMMSWSSERSAFIYISVKRRMQTHSWLGGLFYARTHPNHPKEMEREWVNGRWINRVIFFSFFSKFFPFFSIYFINLCCDSFQPFCITNNNNCLYLIFIGNAF